MTLDKLEIARIHQALDDNHGNRGLAAVALGITSLQLKKKIEYCHELKAAWWGKTPAVPSEADVIRRAPQYIPDEADVRLAERFVAEDKKLAKGLDQLKLTADEKDMARSIAKFNQRHFFRSMDIIGGGVTVIAVKLLGEVSRVQERLVEVRELIAGTRNGKVVGVGEVTDKEGKVIMVPIEIRQELVAEERMLYQTLVDISDTIRRMFDTSFKGQLITAGIQLKLLGRNPNMSQAGKTKPGFQIEEHHETPTEEAAGAAEHADSEVV